MLIVIKKYLSFNRRIKIYALSIAVLWAGFKFSADRFWTPGLLFDTPPLHRLHHRNLNISGLSRVEQ